MSPKLIKKLQLSVLLALCQLVPAHAYEVDPATGNIIWKYFDGKTFEGKNLGGTRYGITYDSNGVLYGAAQGFSAIAPNFLTGPLALGAPKTLAADMTAKINVTLKENRNISASTSTIVLSGDDQTNIRIAAGKKADIWVTFFSEGAGYENGVGFFTYDPNLPPSRDSKFVNTLRTEQIIFPRASTPAPLQSATGEGTTVYLGQFDGGAKGLGIGFFVAANGWIWSTGRTLANGSKYAGVKETQDKGWIFYSLRALNPETAVGNLNQHTILLQDKLLTGPTDGRKYQRLLFGFEDVRRDLGGSDNDFNDVLMVVHASPVDKNDDINTIMPNLSTLPQLTDGTDPDTDGDGVKDSSDEFPKDKEKAYSLWYPGSSTYGTLAYEDQWPNKGDYDFNDVVVRYRSRQVLNAARQVKGLEMDLRLDARGGNNHSGFALAMSGLMPSQIKSGSVVLTKDNVVVPGAVQLAGVTGEGGGVVFEIFPDAIALMPVDSIEDGSAACLSKGFRNTGQGCKVQNFVAFKLSFDLITATSTFPLPPYDPFIFNSAIRGTSVAKAIEVHLLGKQPTSRADKSLFKTGLDYSTLGSNGKYSNSYGTKPALPSTLGAPWALDIPIVWDYPYEGLEIYTAYPGIAAWIKSGGTTNPNWYLSPASAAKTFRNGR
jgi:LruC domain-containing protein